MNVVPKDAPQLTEYDARMCADNSGLTHADELRISQRIRHCARELLRMKEPALAAVRDSDE